MTPREVLEAWKCCCGTPRCWVCPIQGKPECETLELVVAIVLESALDELDRQKEENAK